MVVGVVMMMVVVVVVGVDQWIKRRGNPIWLCVGMMQRWVVVVLVGVVLVDGVNE